MRKSTLIASIAVAPVAIAGLATAAGAATTPHRTPPPKLVNVSASTLLTNRPDSGNNGNWAKDTVTRQLTIHETARSGSTYYFTATVKDSGTFKTIAGAYTPNQAPGKYLNDKITNPASGPMSGNANYSFTANELPNAHLVPSHENGAPSGDQATSEWFMQAFPAHTAFGGSGIGTWSWSYSANVRETTGTGRHLKVTNVRESWKDASNNDAGNAASDGNIN